MKFSTKSRYALRLMAELARYAPGTTVPLKEISERQNLSLKYLEQIVTPLARVGLVGYCGRPFSARARLQLSPMAGTLFSRVPSISNKIKGLMPYSSSIDAMPILYHQTT